MLNIKKKSSFPRDGSPLEHIKPQQREPAPPTPPPVVAAAQTKEPAPRVLMVAGQKYEVKVVNGKRLMEPIASPLPLRKPLKRAREKEKERIVETGETRETGEAVGRKEPEASERVEREKPAEKEESALCAPPGKRVRTRTIQTRSLYRSARVVTCSRPHARTLVGSALFSSLLFVGAALLLDLSCLLCSNKHSTSLAALPPRQNPEAPLPPRPAVPLPPPSLSLPSSPARSPPFQRLQSLLRRSQRRSPHSQLPSDWASLIP